MAKKESQRRASLDEGKQNTYVDSGRVTLAVILVLHGIRGGGRRDRCFAQQRNRRFGNL